WLSLLSWLSHHGMDTDTLWVEPRLASGGYGLFALRSCPPSSLLFTVPGSSMMNIKTLSPHYYPRLTAVQMVSLHLLLHRPENDQVSSDPLFGPYISTLPQDFDSHPLTRLLREGRGLLGLLPPSSATALERLASRFHSDLETVCNYLHEHLDVLQTSSRSDMPTTDMIQKDNDKFVSEYLWGWLNVNTRCIYHQLTKSRSDPDNLTLCPILDFANHTPGRSHMVLDKSDEKKRQNQKHFRVLSSPVGVETGEEVFLTYGAHCNRTLFVEYGFVLHPSSQKWEDCVVEVLVDDIAEELYQKKESVGAWMMDILQTEKYWKDWTLHSHSGSAYLSYRLVTALRLYELVPKGSIPPNCEDLIQCWRLTLSGMQDEISAENEAAWKRTLGGLCHTMIRRAEIVFGLGKDIGTDIETLWREEKYIAQCILDKIHNGEEL
ncbi:SET domain-containing protein, partial [Dendrothele bispora CBS 962.96]